MKVNTLATGLALALFITLPAKASLLIGGTRLVFDGARQAATLSVENKDPVTNLVQSWLSATDSTSPGKDAFIITPPLFRLASGEQAAIRVVRSGKPLPEDRESMLWLNVKGIPASTEGVEKNALQIAINSRIKLIYRPAMLEGMTPARSAEKLEWRVNGTALEVSNTTPHYMNFSSLTVNGEVLSELYFVAPFSKMTIDKRKFPAHGKVTWKILDDYGMSTKAYSQTY